MMAAAQGSGAWRWHAFEKHAPTKQMCIWTRERSVGGITYAFARDGLESQIGTTIGNWWASVERSSSQAKVLMVKATISAVAMAALQLLTTERVLKIDRHLADMRLVSGDANSNHLNLGFKKAVAIDLSADMKEILVADPGTVTVIPRTTRRVYIVGAGLGETNVFFYDDSGRQIAALSVRVSEIAKSQALEFGESPPLTTRAE